MDWLTCTSCEAASAATSIEPTLTCSSTPASTSRRMPPAGCGIAMRDLEIRGAGNLLGVQQSGHIAAVGYELYCQLLENAVRQAQALSPKLSIDVDIDLPGAAHLPTDYVPDMRLKIDLYR